ncbi:acetyl xylan esterase [Rhodopirellula sp. SWK7]|nr:acetyl xylan esterase [Rhodopirellula sp. SWK7]
MRPHPTLFPTEDSQMLCSVKTPFLAACCLFSFAVTCVAETHLFILSGQSNMQGLKEARENSFLPELGKLLPDADIQHIKVVMGGRPIRMWVAEWDTIAEKHGLRPMNQKPTFYPQIIDAYNEKFSDEEKPDTVTFLWMQGEKDAKTNLDAAYEESLMQLIANLRRDLDAPEMNVVIGRISDHSPGEKTQSGWDHVRQIHVNVAQSDPHGAWVDTDDCNNKTKNGKPNNDLHYTAEGYDLFGRRLARQAVRLIKGEEPAENGRPE